MHHGNSKSHVVKRGQCQRQTRLRDEYIFTLVDTIYVRLPLARPQLNSAKSVARSNSIIPTTRIVLVVNDLQFQFQFRSNLWHPQTLLVRISFARVVLATLWAGTLMSRGHAVRGRRTRPGLASSRDCPYSSTKPWTSQPVMLTGPPRLLMQS